MKRALLFIILVLSVFYSQAQESSIMDRFFRKYENDRNFTLFNITPKMFSTFAKAGANDADAQSFVQVVRKLKGLRILVKEKATDAPQLFREANALLRSDFEELMTIREKQSDLKFLIRENSKGHIAELIMLISSDREFMVMSLLGDIDLNEVKSDRLQCQYPGHGQTKKCEKEITVTGGRDRFPLSLFYTAAACTSKNAILL